MGPCFLRCITPDRKRAHLRQAQGDRYMSMAISFMATIMGTHGFPITNFGNDKKYAVVLTSFLNNTSRPQP